MKIAIICHFSNSEVQKLVKPRREINEFAPWVTNYINELYKYPEHQIFIISPYPWLTKDRSFKNKNITFLFFRTGIPFIGRPWPSFIDLDALVEYLFNRRKIGKMIKRIKPDVINLVGAENAYYSSSILQFRKKIPVLITIQGFIGRSTRISRGKKLKHRVEIENKIITKFNNFNLRTEEMTDYVKKIRKENRSSCDINIYNYMFPRDLQVFNVEDVSKNHDFVFFAKITKDKGIYDFLESIKSIKNQKNNVLAIIIGSCGKGMKQYIDNYLKNNGLNDNIKLWGFIKTQEELFRTIKTARISVLPTYNDLIPGTIIESMFLKLPVVTYETGSIPEVNKDRKNIIICKQGNKDELTQEMLKLLNDEKLQKELANNGYEWVTSRYDNDKAMKGYFEALRKIKKDFNKRNSVDKKN